MVSDISGGGAALSAGLAAAVERPETRGGPPPSGPCANCGATLSGNYCASCGQPARIHRKLGAMAMDFLGSFLHFDTRAWRTLPLLLFKPGKLTYEYIHGRRASYVSPLATFLLCVFLMFMVFGWVGGPRLGVPDDVVVNAEDVGSEETAAMIRERVAEARAKASEDDFPGVDGLMTEIREANEANKLEVNTGWPFLDKQMEASLANPELALYKLQNAAYQYAFLLAPISLPFIWLLFFWKRGVTLFDHGVYILYSLSFVSLLFVTATLLNLIGFGGWAWLLAPAALVHSFLHMKGGYGLGWFSALWRMPVHLIFAVIALSFFFVAILVLGLAG